MRLNMYANYRGSCEEAFRFYEQHMGGRITGTVRHKEMPGSPGGRELPRGAQRQL